LLKLVLKSAKQFLTSTVKTLEGSFRKWIVPAKANPLVAGVSDLSKSRAELIAENALLRQQLLVLNRQIQKPKFQPLERLFWSSSPAWLNPGDKLC
jgi:putative transposase